MLKKRLIPVLLLKNGFLVRSLNFKHHNSIGNPLIQTSRYNDWSVDEVIYIDITRDTRYDLRRDDQKLKGVSDIIDILRIVSKTCFMPLAFGGKIKTTEDMSVRFENGADKVLINTICFEDAQIISKAAEKFGSQAVVVGIDAKKHSDGLYEVYSNNGTTATGYKPEKWAKIIEEKGAGEIFLQSIDRDGTGEGYDTDLIKTVVDAVGIPVIACSGVGEYEHFAEGIKLGGASAVAAANIFNFRELSDRYAKRALLNANIDIRI